MKVGFVAIVGRPNVGKSTLLNVLINFDLAITSPLPQTTRDVILGIYNDEESQIIFQDTPGIHKPKTAFGQTLNEKAQGTIKESEAVLFLQPLNEKIGPGDQYIIASLMKTPTKAVKVAVITKLDTSDASAASSRAEELKALGFAYVVGTSVKYPDSVSHLITFLKSLLPIGPRFFNPEEVTTAPMRFIASEQIREAALKYLKDELPHALRVHITSFIEPHDESDLFEIEATLFTERESQKGIVIGEGGLMIRNIGTTARQKLQQALEAKVRLDLQVKVDKNWTSLKSSKKH